MSTPNRSGIYGYGIQTVDFDTAVAASGGLAVRADSFPEIKPGLNIIDQSERRGEWGDHEDDRRAGVKKPTFAYPGLLRNTYLKLVFDALMNPSADGSGWDYELKAMTSGTPDTTKSLSLFQRFTSLSSKDVRLTGAFPVSVKINSTAERNVGHLDVDFIGSDYDKDVDGSGGTYTIPSESPLLHTALVVELDDSSVYVSEVDITLNFNTAYHYDNESTPHAVTLGKLEVSGSFKAPFEDHAELADYLTQTSAVLELIWGTAAQSGYLEIDVPVQYDEPSREEGENRIIESIPFVLATTDSQELTVDLQI